ncbi:MAG TPA: aminomethyl-transferring glycine dehydrogenase subunit GcvPA, partial [Candidatus Sulfotelmatobacter sp.]|nr:aminomethyl-transferring glycine dehydrogenase subunit GcvPA [Candidatus Sulfotelmatobacter sp.]
MRYLPLTPEDRRAMLARIGVPSVDALFRDVPEAARLKAPLDLPDHAGELEVERAIAALAAKNLPTSAVPSFLGAGAYRHHVPVSVDHLIQRSEFLTSYTPYQPEIAQGTLQMLFEFQTQVALITGMEVANASMYDGPTGCAEAVLMAARVTRRKRALLSGALHPHYREVTATVLAFADETAEFLPPEAEGDEDLAAKIDGETTCVVVQNPDVFGRVRDLRPLAAACHAKGALLVAVVCEVVSLGALTPPGAMGADIVVAEGQSLGVPLGFGGPYVGLFATREKFMRQMPGRLCGQTVDQDGRRGYVLTLSAREQHIRREKATSNICTNSGLCALAFTIHMSLLGEAGLRLLAKVNHANAVALADRLAAVRGVSILNEHFFNEFTLRVPRRAVEVIEALARKGVIGGVPVSRLLPKAGLDDLI